MPVQKKSVRTRKQNRKKTASGRSLREVSEHIRKLGHDLNNALAPITLYAGILKASIQDSQNQSMIENIEQAARRSAIIADKVSEIGHQLKGADGIKSRKS